MLEEEPRQIGEFPHSLATINTERRRIRVITKTSHPSKEADQQKGTRRKTTTTIPVAGNRRHDVGLKLMMGGFGMDVWFMYEAK